MLLVFKEGSDSVLPLAIVISRGVAGPRKANSGKS